MLVGSNQAQFLVQFECSQGCSRLVQYYFSEKKKKIMGLMNRIPLTTTKEHPNTYTAIASPCQEVLRCSTGMPISYFIESAFYQINLCSKKSARSVAGCTGMKNISDINLSAPQVWLHLMKSPIYIFLLLHICSK